MATVQHGNLLLCPESKSLNMTTSSQYCLTTIAKKIATFCFVVLLWTPSTAQSRVTGTLGEIRMFAGSFAPREWAFCDGQLLPIAQHRTLYEIIGTTYGGNGITNFALPDLRGRAPMHVKQGPGLTNRILGEKYGTESTGTAIGNTAAGPGRAGNVSVSTMTGSSTTVTDNNMQPSLGINYIICISGLFPSKN